MGLLQARGSTPNRSPLVGRQNRLPMSLSFYEPIVISDESDDEPDAGDPLDDIDLLDDDLGETRSRSTTPLPTAGYEILQSSLVPAGFVVRPGDNVELNDETFLRIVQIYQHDFSNEVRLKGILFVRARNVGTAFARQMNEVVAILPAPPDIANPAVDSSLVTRLISDVRMLREITLTNTSFPAFSFHQDGKKYFGREATSELGGLTCRWKYAEFIKEKKKKEHVLAGAIMLLTESEADTGKTVSDIAKKLHRLRTGNTANPSTRTELEIRATPDTNKRRSSTSGSPFKHFSQAANDQGDDDVKIIEKLSTPSKRVKHESCAILRRGPTESFARVRKSSSLSTSSYRTTASTIDLSSAQASYSYGDICAGAGAMARGATETGDVQVSFTVDNWNLACNTLRRNFRGAHVLETEIFDFCQHLAPEIWMLVDILHVSFPCQYWSQAHTIAGKNDEANIAAIYSVGPLIERTRPRVITFEQAPGLIRLEKHRYHWQALLHQITTTGYSVRWKILPCSAYGGPQTRNRLFLIASCPGEPLPPFPTPTHGPGLLPLVTIQDCLDRLPPNREIERHMLQCSAKNERPTNPNVPLRRCMTTDGGSSNTHPSGKRSFTCQELALLQTIPIYHLFAESKMGALRKQIGNAVPCAVAEKIFSSVVKSMRAEDRRVEAWRPEEISLLDDDD